MPRGSSQTTIELEPSVLRWARERVGFDEETLARSALVVPCFEKIQINGEGME